MHPAVATISMTDRARSGRGRRSLAVLAVLLSAWLSSPPATAAPAAAAGDLFERYEVATGGGKHQTVLPGFFLGGATADIAVVYVDAAGARHLRLYGFDGDGWSPSIEATLRPGLLFVDVAALGGRDRLLTYEHGRLSWFDPEAATERTLLEVATSYRSTEPGAIPRIDVTRDLNGDGRDDLVIPDVDGFWISTQAGDGSFVEAVKLGPPEPFRGARVGGLDLDEPAADGERTYGEVGITPTTAPWYLGRVHRMDNDQDGRTDLAFWNKDHFDVHRQTERGTFEPRAETLAVDVPFDADGVYSRMFDYVDQGVGAILFGLGETSERTVLDSVRDVNGDRVADLVTLTLSGKTLLKQRGVYEVHFGRATPDGLVFARDAGTAIQPRGRGWGIQPWGYASKRFDDLDGDGQVDAEFRGVRTGIGGMMRALVGNSVAIDVALYRLEDGVYPERPSARRRVRRFAPFAGIGNIFFPPVLVGDVNGDGRQDLLVGRSPKELHVFFGVPGPELLARSPLKVAVEMPPDERASRLLDLNRDGKQDLMVQFGPTDRAPHRPHSLTVHIAR